MRWVTYLSPASGRDRPGLLHKGHVHGLADPLHLVDLLGDDGARLREAAARALRDPEEVVPLGEARLRAPVPSPPSVRDFMAFEQHVVTAHEARGATVDPGWYEAPVFYFSNPAAVFGPTDDIPIAPGSAQFDYELEVAVVVGAGGANLEPEEAERHIAGFMVLCDWSARDLQAVEMRQGLGPAKGKDTATSLGPYLVTPDELEPRRTRKSYDLTMTARVNGRLYSSGSLADLQWSFGQMLAYASRGTRLRPGDVIGSGTVGTGCILELSLVHGHDRYPWLMPGDDVVIEVENLGAVAATIVPGAEVKQL